MKNFFSIILILTIKSTVFGQEDIFNAIEKFDTSFVKNYIQTGGNIDIVKIEKVGASSFKSRRTKMETNLFEHAILRITYSEESTNPRYKILAQRNFSLLLENIHKSKKREEQLARVFTHSISLSDIDLTRRIYQMGANINYRCKLCFGRPALLIALGYNQDFEMIKFLLSLNPDLTITDYDGKNAIHYAAQTGNLPIIKYLLENKLIDINAADNSGKTPLMYAAKHGNYEIFNFLVEKGADMNITGKKGFSVLHAAVESGDVDFFRHVHYISQLPLWTKGWRKKDVYQLTTIEEMADEAIRLYIVRYTIREFGKKHYKKCKRKLIFKRIFA